MKIYQLEVQGEKEWICANTAIHALKIYKEITGKWLTDFDDEDDIIEVPEDKWDDLTIHFPDDEKEPQTFRELMNETSVPTYLCSTVY